MAVCSLCGLLVSVPDGTTEPLCETCAAGERRRKRKEAEEAEERQKCSAYWSAVMQLMARQQSIRDDRRPEEAE